MSRLHMVKGVVFNTRAVLCWSWISRQTIITNIKYSHSCRWWWWIWAVKSHTCGIYADRIKAEQNDMISGWAGVVVRLYTLFVAPFVFHSLLAFSFQLSAFSFHGRCSATRCLTPQHQNKNYIQLLSLFPILKM